MGAPSTAATTAGASKAATAANTKDLISSFLQKDREELLQCKISTLHYVKMNFLCLLHWCYVTFVVI